MKKKGRTQANIPKTARFSKREEEKIYEYLKNNPVFENLSTLIRVATLTFIQKESFLGLNPLSSTRRGPSDVQIDPGTGENRPYFLAEQNITEARVRDILKGGHEIDQVMLTSRLLSEGHWEDIWSYTTPENIIRLFPKLWFMPESKRAIWHNVLEEWKETGELICPKEFQQESQPRL